MYMSIKFISNITSYVGASILSSVLVISCVLSLPPNDSPEGFNVQTECAEFENFGLTRSSIWDHIPEDCGLNRFHRKNLSYHRVVNGQEAKLGQFPWLVKLGTRKSSGRIFFFCGGSLINRYFVLSAMHCGTDVDIVRIGENFVETEVDCDEDEVCAPPHQDVEPLRYVTASFSLKHLANDIMLIELEKPAILNDFVQPVCLPRQRVTRDSLIGKDIFAPGWGRTIPERLSSPSRLLYTVVPVITEDVCRIYTKVSPIVAFCGLDESGQGKGVCKGDSGGPATIAVQADGVERHYLVGITGFVVPKCGGVNGFVNLSHYLERFLMYVDKS